ncbi:hypothetical protein OT109_05085 [Phycisphaeraceae bacterium D3-23]
MLNQQRNAAAVVLRVAMVLVLLCLMSAASAQDGESPLRLSDVNRMIRGDQTPAQVVEAAAERGIDFELSRQTLRRLDSWGFSEAQVEQLRRIAAGEAPDDAEMPDEDAEGADADEDFPVGYRENDGGARRREAADRARDRRGGVGLRAHRAWPGHALLQRTARPRIG